MAEHDVTDSGWADLGLASDMIVQRITTNVVEIVRADADPGAGVKGVGVKLWSEDPHIAFPANADETKHAWARSESGAAKVRVI